MIQIGRINLVSGLANFLADWLEKSRGEEPTCIIVLRNGRIIESGTHEQLIHAHAYYAPLVERQTRGLIRNDGE